MASPTQWTWVWVNSGSWWWTGKPCVLQSMGMQRVTQALATEQQQQMFYVILCKHLGRGVVVLCFIGMDGFLFRKSNYFQQQLSHFAALQCVRVWLLCNLPVLVRVLHRFSHVWIFVTTWTVAHQAPLSMGFSKHEYWSGFPCPPPEDIPHPGIKGASPALQADSLPLSHQGSPQPSWVL